MFDYKMVPVERVSIFEDFRTFLAEKSVSCEQDITKENIRDYVIEKRKQPGDINNTINAIHEYFYAVKNDFLAFEAGSYLDSAWHYQIISELTKSKLGEEVWQQIFENVQMPKIGWTLDEFADFTRQMHKGMNKVASQEQIESMIQKHAHGSQPPVGNDLHDILKSKGIDGLIIHLNDSMIKEAEQCRDKGELWWATEVDDSVLNFYEENPRIYRDGNKIINKKHLALPKRYLHETDENMKRYHACHCALKRQSILQNEGGLSHSLCYCCLGHDMKPFEAAFERELTGRVLHTVMDNGCLECVFEIDIPDEFIEGKEV